MSQQWENPDYGNYRRRRMRLALVLLLAMIAASAFWLLYRDSPDSAGETIVKKTRHEAADIPQAVPLDTAGLDGNTPVATLDLPPAAIPTADPGSDNAWRVAEGLFAAGRFEEALGAYRRLAPSIPAGHGRAGICLARLGRWDEAVAELLAGVAAQPNDFEMRSWLARAFYRQNDLESALEQVQAALALRMDGELLELRAKLETEIRVQRNYDDARTANFIVLFDGYEHDEMKPVVLDILKSAYAEIGKELDHFPDQPITVILYTTKDFSDVTLAPEWAGGMFGQLDGKIRVPVQGLSGHEQALRRVLYHEYTHALLFAMAPECPLWLHEGLAQYFCGDRAVSMGQAIPLRMLVNTFPGEARLAYAAYMECLQAVTDLVGEHGLSRLRRLLDGLGDGEGLEKAFSAAYGEPFSRWAEEWRPLQNEE